MSKARDIGIWCETVFGLYSLPPIINKYSVNNAKITVYTRYDIKDLAINYLKIDSANVKIIDKLDKFYIKILFGLFVKLRVDPKFSIMYTRFREGDSFSYKYITKIFGGWIPSIKTNQLFCKYFSIFSYKFPHDMLISITRISAPYLLSNPGCKHISIMESWDHPVKAPYYINPDISITWNESLKDDLKKYQGFTRLAKMKPLKFRYILERKFKDDSEIEKKIVSEKYISDLEILKRYSPVIYICTTSSVNPKFHIGEIKLINQLRNAVRSIGKNLYIKPKPNGVKGDYDIFLDDPNVYIGVYSSDPNSLDMLDEEYQSFRYLLLRNSNIIVNMGTTFVLEAALLDVPILQLGLNALDYGDFGSWSNNPHIKKYLLINHSLTFNGNLEDLTKNIINPAMAKAYSRNLKEWILN